MASVALQNPYTQGTRSRDDLFGRCLLSASVAGVVFLIVIFLTPVAREVEIGRAHV